MKFEKWPQYKLVKLCIYESCKTATCLWHQCSTTDGTRACLGLVNKLADICAEKYHQLGE